jgi:hypothetical protein
MAKIASRWPKRSSRAADGTPIHLRMDGPGLERFLTATRRQNFLIPPRRHRAFPLVELA